MTTNTRNTVLSFIQQYTFVDYVTVASAFGKRKMSEKMDNRVGRFLRRLATNGVLKRTERGAYKLTAKGNRYISKQLA